MEASNIHLLCSPTWHELQLIPVFHALSLSVTPPQSLSFLSSFVSSFSLRNIFLYQSNRLLTHRFQRNSETCEKLAQSLYHLTTVEERGLFDFGSRGQEASPLVLILDRKDDPVTPLLLQWTYQAMVHELIGLDTNRVDLSHIPGVRD